mgnify:FL=1
MVACFDLYFIVIFIRIFLLLQLTVTLTDINDNAPRFDISEYVGGRAFREDATPGTLIATGMILLQI